VPVADDQQAAADSGTTSTVVGLLVSEAKLSAVLAGRRDTVYCRYARYAREVGSTLVVFAISGVHREEMTVSGYVHRCGWGTACTWSPLQVPFPAVVYDRCFGKAGRAEAAQIREIAHAWGAVVVNHLPKITKLQTFESLQEVPEVAAYLPLTVRLTPESLASALADHDDLYVKPDALYKGKGIYRLKRTRTGWLIQTREDWGNAEWEIPVAADAQRALERMLDPEDTYLIQEGLQLATYLGSRFDFRSLVQKDGRGHWTVSGLVARLAPVGSVITSPRSGGQTAPADRVLRHAFPERWEAILALLQQASLTLAERIDDRLGPCTELGLDMAVLQDGSVKMIEANGKPLRVSLERLKDPVVRERIHRFPIHHTAFLAGAGALALGPQAEVGNPPGFGILLGTDMVSLLHGRMRERYQRMYRDGLVAGVRPIFFTIEGVGADSPEVEGWVERSGEWVQVRTPIPDVIWHRATYASFERRYNALGLLWQLQKVHGVTLLNGVNSVSKSQVYEALSFFPGTAHLTPASMLLAGRESLLQMLETHQGVFVKKDHGSHGSDVLCVLNTGDGWEVRGSARGTAVEEIFADLDQLTDFLSLVQGGQPWVVQQRIDIPKVANRPFDLRAVLQKDGRGEWKVPLLLVRQARPGSVAANMSQGGTPYLPEIFLAEYGAHLPGLAGMVQTATHAALLTAEALEARFGSLGELGVDIGLDQEGRPWIFEANTKPLHPMLPGVWERLTRLPSDYAVYLAARARRGRYTDLLK
jgi:hypothetical protein